MRPDETFEVMNCDVIGPAEHKSARGYAYVMVVIDQCSRWLEAIPSRTLTAKAAYDVFLEVFACTDIPKVLVCDNAINFTAALITEFKKRLGCVPRFLTPYHPEGNAVVDRQNATIKNMSHHVVREDRRNWDKHLSILLWAIRDVPNIITGLSPYQLVYGKIGRGPLSVLKDTWTGELSVPQNFGKLAVGYMQKLKERLEIAKMYASEHAENKLIM